MKKASLTEVSEAFSSTLLDIDHGTYPFEDYDGISFEASIHMEVPCLHPHHQAQGRASPVRDEHTRTSRVPGERFVLRLEEQSTTGSRRRLRCPRQGARLD
jgi:hypothetical protein